MSEHHFFYLGLCFILMHEMDAIRCREWSIFPGLSLLNDKLGFQLFMFLHIPLFFGVFAMLLSSSKDTFIFGMNLFFILHMLAHLLALKHPQNQFKDWVSWSIIVSAAICGGLDVAIYG